VGQALPKASEQAGLREPLAVRLFGHADLAVGGRPFALATPRKSLEVIAYLLLHRAAPVSRDYLAFTLFPDDEEGTALSKLRRTLSDLLRVLPQPASSYITIDTEKIAWNRDGELWLDVDAFVEAAKGSHLDEAIDLYRGDLLPEIYDEWLDAIRERHRNTYLRCLSERVSLARREADLGLAIETARKILAVDPWREDVVRRIVAMRYESGDRAGALSEYLAFAERLRTEMAADPMAETLAVVEVIARGEALPDERVEVPSAAGRPPVLPFVGRRAVMDAALRAWDAVARGRGCGLFLAGESGIGKTRVARELAHAVEDRGGIALVGTTGSPEAVPYESIADALRAALPLLAALKPDTSLACVAALVPELRSRVALTDPPALGAEAERIRLFESLHRCLAALAATRPVLLVLEDLHWAQPATLDLVRYLLRRSVEARVLILVTHRDEDTPRVHPLRQLRNEARATSGVAVLALAGLTTPEVEQLRAACQEISDRSAEGLLAASHGNPLFLAQLVSDAREGAQTPAPTTLAAVVDGRIARLSDRARTAAEIAACLGERFSREAVREVTAWDDNDVSDALDELLDRRIVREVAGRGVFEYAFAHRAVLEAIAAAMPPERAVARRRRLGRVLEELYPGRADELAGSIARLYDLGGDAPNAARCYLTATRYALALNALEDASSLCERGLDLGEGGIVRAGLLGERVKIESRRGMRLTWEAALDALDVADAALGDPAFHRDVVQLRIEWAQNFGDRVVLERAVEALQATVPGGDPRATAQLELARARLGFVRDRFADSYAAAQAALVASRSAGDDLLAAHALCALAEVEAYRGHLSEAASLFEQAGSIATRANDAALAQVTLRSEWVLAYQRRDASRAVSLAERALQLAIDLGDRPQEADAHGRLGVALTYAGERYAAAREHFAAAIDIVTSNGDPRSSASALLNRAVLESRLGYFDRAVALNAEATDLFRSGDNLRAEATGLENAVLLLALAGDNVGARDAAERAISLARRLELVLIEVSAQENLAFVEAREGRLERAVALAEKAIADRARHGSDVWSSKTLADVALWYALLGEMDEAREAVRRLLADDDAVATGTEWPQYCYWAAAQVLRLDGKPDEARAALDRARAIIAATADRLEADDRLQFLSIPWHTDIAAAERGEWPDPPRF
jgi:DNA-binding SARP family transcriptional activator/tetratricopeptide (TPR) repeat protein